MSTASRAKTAQACDPCRSLKVRCMPSSQPGVCKKCLNSKPGRVSCTWAELKPRQRISKPSSKARVTAVETKLNELIARVDQSQASKDESASGRKEGRVVDSPFTTSTLHSRDSLFSVPTTGSIPEAGFDFGTPLDLYAGYPRVNTDQSLPDLLLSCGLSIAAAEVYLLQFRDISIYFPFVIVPNNATVLSMSQDRPFLCLAALAAATSSEKALQKSLEQSFRIAILQKIMLDSERSLDLLNGLLVYLAWYHFYYMPKREQCYQLLQMAIGTCVDLGLNLRPAEAVARKVGLRLSHYHKADQTSVEHDAFYSREARRVYLGCYYLSTTTAWVTGKQSNIQITNYMGKCGASLADEMEYPTDAMLLPLIQLQQMAEENHKNLSMARGKIHSKEEVQRIQTHLSAFRIQLDNWKAGLSPMFEHSPIIEMAGHFAGIHVHEMDLINPFSKIAHASKSRTVSASGSFSSSIRLDVLLACLEATKQFCEGFLAIPAAEYRHMSFIQWSGLICATVVLYKLSIGLPQVPEWDVRVTRNAISIEVFLETLCSRMCSVAQSDPATLEKADLFSMMGPIFGNVKRTYDRLKQLPQSQSANDTNPVHATSFPMALVNVASPLKTYQHPCPAFPFWKSQGSDVSLFHGVEGFPSGSSPANTMVGDAFSSFDLLADHDFWGGAMPEAAPLSGGWNFSNLCPFEANPGPSDGVEAPV